MWIIYQLLSYSVFNWIVFLCIAFVGAKRGGKLGIIVGHFLVALVVFGLDFRYAVTHEYMDIDIAFYLGFVARVILINIVLLLVSFIGWRIHQKPSYLPSMTNKE